MRPVLAALALLLAAGPAAAQADGTNGEDWTYSQDRFLTSAVVSFNEGQEVVIRCRRGTMEVSLRGLPEVAGGAYSRTLEVSFDDAPPRPTFWVVGQTTTSAYAIHPAFVARKLRAGGLLRVVVPAAAGGLRREYRLDLPPSPAAIDAVLNACGRSQNDPRDTFTEAAWFDLDAPDIAWRVRAPAQLPRLGDRRVDDARVDLSCMVEADGRLRACQVENEMPGRLGFGRAALEAMPTARVQTPVHNLDRPIYFTISWHLHSPEHRRAAPAD